MNKIRWVFFGLALLLLPELHGQIPLTSDQVISAYASVGATDPIPAATAPIVGLFYSAQNPSLPPMPGNFGNLPAWDLGNGDYLLDDVDATRTNNEQAQQADDGPPAPPGEGGSGSGGGSTNGFYYSFDTNGLWLETAGLSHGWLNLVLHNATNQVYALWSASDLRGPWSVQTEVWPTDGWATAAALPVDGQQSLFVRAQDWTGVTENGNLTPDWWLWEYFGTTALSDTNQDSQGNSLYNDYISGSDPNAISFRSSIANEYVSNAAVPITVTLLYGSPYFMAVLVDDTNRADAVWQPYDSNIVAHLGAVEGQHSVGLGLRGFAPSEPQQWNFFHVTLATTPPVLVLTNPSAATLSDPMAQVQGYCAGSLATLTYDLTNASGTLTNQTVSIVNQSFEGNAIVAATNFFQAFDVPLAPGTNVLTFHAADAAGNVATTNFIFTVDYSTRTNPPVVALYWPQNGGQVSGSNFCWRGAVDDFNDPVQINWVDTNGVTHSAAALVERTGNFWAQNLPLQPGTNLFTLTALDAASNLTTTNLVIVQNPVTLAIAPVDGSLLWAATATVNGSISDSSYSVWVNGAPSVNNGDGTWTATNVPINPEGTAVFQARAIPDSETNGMGAGDGGGGSSGSYAHTANPNAPDALDAELSEDKPDRVYLQHYTLNFKDGDNATGQELIYGFGILTNQINSTDSFVTAYTWTDNQGGGGAIQTTDDDNNNDADCAVQVNWPPSLWPALALSTGSYEGNCDFLLTIPHWPELQLEHCDLDQPTDADVTNWTMSETEAGPVYDNVGEHTGQIYNRSAQGTLHLFVGGKQTPGSSVLYDLTAGIYDQIDPTPIANQSITIGGLGNLDADGHLYQVLATGDHDITPSTPGRANYTFSANPAGHKPIIVANGIDLSANTPTFCVGQQVTFALGFSPPLPFTPSNVLCHWKLPDKFVNTSTTNDVGCVLYSNDPTLLDGTNLTCAPCWYVNGKGGPVSIGANIITPSGKSVSLAAMGMIIIHRPQINIPSPIGTLPYGTSFDSNSVVLALAVNQMNFQPAIKSMFPGIGNYVQLINADRWSDIPFNYEITHGYWLDNTYPYLDSSILVHPSDPNGTYIPFVDAPSFGGFETVSVNDQFKTYLIFKPDPISTSIWITLGEMDWYWTASAQKISSSYWDITAPTPTLNGPIDTDGFPFWPSVMHNGTSVF